MIYNRQWYRETAPKIIREWLGSDRRSTHVIAGNKGTGKSVFGFVLMMQALADGLTVLYHTASFKFWIVGEEIKERYKGVIRKVFEQRGYDPALSTGVYEVDSSVDNALFSKLNRSKGVMYIVDIGDAFLGEIESRGPKVVISSPNADKLKRVAEIDVPKYWFMPLWSWGEICSLNDKLESAPRATKYTYKPKAELKSLFTVFGGVPRHLFEDISLKLKLDDVDTTVSTTSFAVWQNVFATHVYAKLPKEVPGKLVHIIPPEATGDCRVEFASGYIAALAMHRFYTGHRAELLAFLNAGSPSRMVSAMRGALVEECMHEAFGRNNQILDGLEVRKLTPGHDFQTLLSFPALRWKWFKFLDMSDITEIERNDYYQPLLSNFPAVDAIALMTRRVFDPSGPDEQVGVGFQATVSKNKRKGVARDELVRVRNNLRVLTNIPTLPLLLVFVTVVGGINSRQRLGKTTEPGDEDFEQFVIRGISFEATRGMKNIPEVAEE
jgi:hypothetical protein